MKAFNSVPHKRLIQKLPAYGINTKVISWTQSFLTNRRQRVLVNGEESSSWSKVISGIPQGSILGPLLFMIYINDLPSITNSNILLFADDTKLYKEIHSATDKEEIQQDIDNMISWSRRWLLKFHPSKCKLLQLGNNIDLKGSYLMENTLLEITDKEKDLGITINNQLNFEAHISEKTNKANNIMGLIRRTFSYLDKTIFKALVRPHIEYGNAVWYTK